MIETNTLKKEFMIPDGDNLVTHYILPLVKINKKFFGRSFDHSFISSCGSTVWVRLKTRMENPNYKNTPFYGGECIGEDRKTYVYFNLDPTFQKDAEFFIKGNYSKISVPAKKLIYSLAVLPYNKTMGSFKNTHPILQALEKTKSLRSFLKDSLGLKELPESLELIDKPDKSWFIENYL